METKFDDRQQKKSKLIRRCCCSTLQLGCLFIAACCVAMCVFALLYSAWTLSKHGGANAERQMCWALQEESAKFIYRIAQRAQKSYEQICSEALNWTFLISTTTTGKRKKRATEPLLWTDPIERLTENIAENPETTRIQRRLRGTMNTTPSMNETRKEVNSSVEVSAMTVTPFSPNTQVTHMCSSLNCNKSTGEKHSRLHIPNLTENGQDQPRPLEDLEAPSDRGDGAGESRAKRAYSPFNMSYTCIQQAEAAKRYAFMYYLESQNEGQDDICANVQEFYRGLDIVNIILNIIEFIFAMILIFGVARSINWMILMWLATYPFYVIFELFFLYFRVMFMLQIHWDFNGKWAIGLIVILVVIIVICIIKFYIIFCFWWLVYTPAYIVMNNLNNMQLIVSRRG